MEIKRDTGLFKQFLRNYWEYYRELEKDFLSIRKYVSICEDNSNTYSIEILKLYQAVCSEIDVLGKAMAQLINPLFKPENTKNNIYKWWYEIQDYYMLTEAPYTFINPNPNPLRIGLREYRCRLLDLLDFQPWIGFSVEIRRGKKKNYYAPVTESKTPGWWTDYNKVKHTRTLLTSEKGEKTNYSKANLGNLCNAFAALYILEKAVIDTIGTEDDLTRFLDHSVLFIRESRYTNTEAAAIFEARFGEMN